MRRPLALLFITSICGFGGCGSPKVASEPAATPTPAVAEPAATPTPAVAEPAVTPTPAVAEPAATPTPADPAPGATTAAETKEGMLVYEELPKAQSVRAYTGAEFFLEGAGEREVLRPSAAVSRDRLLGLAGKRVRVRAEWTEGVLPRPDEPAPLGANNEPMRRGAGWRVLAIDAL